jgi:hypothetical protein
MAEKGSVAWRGVITQDEKHIKSEYKLGYQFF